MPKKNGRTAYFTKRGVHFGNMWAVYSLKAESVLLLGSDRQLAHWLLQLEFSPLIKSFVFQPAYKEYSDETGICQIHYHVEVFPIEGLVELHYIRTTGNSADYSDKVDAANRIRYRYIEFNDEDWERAKFKILPLLRVSSFLNGGRNTYVPQALSEKAIKYLNTARHGTLRTYLSAHSAYDQNLCMLVFCRQFLAGQVEVDFEHAFFDLDTTWWLYEQ